LAEKIAVPASVCYPLPETIDLSLAALTEPLAVAVRAVKNSGFQDFSEKSVLILGGGPIGLAVNVVLRTKGARKVYFSEPTEKRRKYNGEVAEGMFDPTSENVGEKCREVTGGEGVDVLFDCAGVERAMKDGFDALRFGGVYVNVAGWVTPVCAFLFWVFWSFD
jgi:(R,R)-butanediol dehydrogenase/meso-butanediol dehydrogenase/diacetyl reductase